METGAYLCITLDPFIFSSAEECVEYYYEKKNIPKEFIRMADWAAGQTSPKRYLSLPSEFWDIPERNFCVK